MDTKRIDFVITWVDGTDAEWQKEKKKHEKNINLNMNTESRYRDWEILRYWFRAVEKHANWVNKIFFITQGHVPAWLNKNHKKLVVVKHDDFIKQEYLPTFNSNVIELSIGNISEISETFVMFNDDMFINDTVSPNDFFREGKPCDSGVFSPIIPIAGTIDSIILNNIEIINDNFLKSVILKNNFFKFFNILYGKHLVKNICTLPWENILGFYDNHIPISYSKKVYKEVLNKQDKVVRKTLQHKFRTREDINHWLIRYWQLCTGYFSPRSTSFGKYYNIGVNQKDLLEDIRYSKHKVICLNDNDLLENYEKYKVSLIQELEKKYEVKSEYEN